MIKVKNIKLSYFYWIFFIFGLLFFLVSLLMYNNSHAYYTALINEKNPGGDEIRLGTNELAVSFDSNSSINISSIEVGWTLSKTFTITNESSNTQTYRIEWRNISNTFKNSKTLVYELTGDKTKNQTRVPLKANPIVSNIEIDASETHSYTLTMSYIDIPDTDYSIDTNAMFSGNIAIVSGESEETIDNIMPNQNAIEKLAMQKIQERKAVENPVGTIIMNTTNTNPEEYLGFGTWERVAKGKTIVGVDTGDATFALAATEGGSKFLQAHTHTGPSHTHTIAGHAHTISKTTSSAGAHSHSLNYNIGRTANEASPYGINGSGAFQNRVIIHTGGGTSIYLYGNGGSTHTFSATTSSAGSGNTGSAGNLTTSSSGTGDSENLMPYYTTYIWQRIA